MSRADIITLFGAVARPIMRQYVRADSCIASTWMTIETLKLFRVTAYEQPFTLRVFNAVTLAELRRAARPDAIDWDDVHARGGWAMAIGQRGPGAVLNGTARTNERGTYDGHLAAIVPSRRVIIDASLDQCSRPAKGIIFEHAAVLRQNGPEPWQYEVNGCGLEYRAHGDRTYTTAADWTGAHRDTYMQCVREIAAAIREKLNRKGMV